MTVEEIELRKILRSMLAEAGITRDSLKEVVDGIVKQKLEQIVANKIAQELGEKQLINRIANTVWDRYRFALSDLLRDEVAKRIASVTTDIIVHIPKEANVTINEGV